MNPWTMGLHRVDTCVLLIHLSLQVVWSWDKVVFLNPPDEPVSGYPLRVAYSCDKPTLVQLECIVSFDTGKTSMVLQRNWNCEPGPTRVHTLILRLPDWLVYKPDWAVPVSQWVHTAMLRASLRDHGSTFSHGTSFAQRAVAVLQTAPPLSRPLKQHRLCLDWRIQMLTKTTAMPKCPSEQVTAHLLSSIYASAGENYGVMRTLQPYNSEVLEHLRLKAVSFPWCALSMWMFLTQYCQQRYCGLLYHIDSSSDYATPTLFLTDTGQVHIQMHGGSAVSSAFLCAFQMPLGQWCRLHMELRGRKVDVTMVCLDGEQKSVYFAQHIFTHHVELNDTDGYVVIGGSQYANGIKGYYGPMVYYRNQIPPLTTSEEVLVPGSISKTNLTGWLQSCHNLQSELRVKTSQYLQDRRRIESEICMGAYCQWRLRLPRPVPQCGSWEHPSVPRRRHALQLSKSLASKQGGGELDLAAVGQALYSLSVRLLDQGRNTEVVAKILPLLLQAGCLGNNQALHTASVIYRSGLGVCLQPDKALQLSLLGAQRNSRLALLHLGHLYHLGESGITPDLDLAYAYYSHIAKQTSSDRLKPSPQQTYVESVYLNNEEVLRLQTNENHDLFHWLKLQARNGAADAEQAVARMLFWGQQGVSPDIHTAVKHYERGAVRLEDPTSMYDYAIVLLLGHGVQKDIPRAVMFLKKSAEQGFTPALNALGWYYERFEKEYELAVQLWEQADAQGSPDAAMNLGVMYAQGLYPGQPADQFKAYQYYQKSAQRGHVDGAIQLANVWTMGLRGHIQRRPANAVLWAKWAAEHNGYLGMNLRKALNSYFKGNMLMSLLYYLMVAESGYATAQFNAAYLCEHNTGGFLSPAYAAQCMRRYYNLTIRSQDPDPYALIRMGDLLSEGHKGRRDVAAAADMYKQAALRGDPQGWYSLGLLVQAEQKVPLPVLAQLGLAELYVADSSVLLSVLYHRCRDSNGTADSYLPCSLALFSAYMQSLQRDCTETFTLTGSVALAVVAPPILLLVLRSLRGRGSLHL
ncbi:protein sel-1 homolog 3 isoform X2 [Hypomesus transpacificus]|uniref:protein sel-1 homolog 3 isoform X2 n=1 Tax=Hypomesus transpacificus TaxID=137520 RepID=UPI001F07AF91|nr:protein sel-1 homolog 3 isoform X2 [Hypomesus transpacificus]